MLREAPSNNGRVVNGIVMVMSGPEGLGLVTVG